MPGLEGAPTPKGPLDFVPDMVLAALHRRGSIRLELNAMSPAVRDTDIQWRQECKATHAELLHQEDSALQQLLAVMGDPSPRNESYGDIKYTSWHYSEREVPGHGVIPLAHKVKATVKDGKLHSGYAAQVETHVLHRSLEAPGKNIIRFTGFLGDMVAFDGYTRERTVPGCKNKLVASFGNLESEIIASLSGEARKTALAPWAKGLLELEEPTGLSGDRAPLKFEKVEQPWVQLLTQPRSDYEATLKQLAGLPDDYSGLLSLLKYNVELLNEALQSYGPGATAAFEWLMQNVVPMQRQTREAVRHSVAFGFKAAFAQRLQEEQNKVAEVAALAHQLNTTCQNINDCAPSK